MTTLRILACISSFALLTGCAAAPKPAMPASQYGSFAAMWTAIEKCGVSGMMSPADASLGQRYVAWDASTFTVDADRMNSALGGYKNLEPKSTDCNRAAMFVADRKRQVDQANAAVAADQKAWSDMTNNRAKQTYCNKIGTQVLCSTY